MPEGGKKIANCPTCGKSVDKLRAPAIGIFSNRILYFCSKSCKELFATAGAPEATKQSQKQDEKGAYEPVMFSQKVENLECNLKEEKQETEPVNFYAAEENSKGKISPQFHEVKSEIKPEDKKNKILIRGTGFSKIVYLLIFIASQFFVFVLTYLLGGKFPYIATLFFIGGICILQFVYILKTWERTGKGVALDEILICFGILLYIVPVFPFLFNIKGDLNFSKILNIVVVPLILVTLIWIGRLLEELGKIAIARDSGLKTETWKSEMKGAPLLRFSYVMSKTVMFLSIILPLGILLFKTLGKGEGFLDAKIWAFASTISIACSPRLFRNTIFPSFCMALINGGYRGINFISEGSFEKCSIVDAVVFRKRGGVAQEETRVIEMKRVGSVIEESLLALVLGCEEDIKESEIARALTKFAGRGKVKSAGLRLKRFYPSKGIHSTSPYGEIMIGSRNFLVDGGISLAGVEEMARERERRGETVVFLSVDRKIQALFMLENAIKPQASKVCKRLKKSGITPIIISGDSTRTVETIAEGVGVEHVRAEIPADSYLSELERIRDTGHRIAIVGKLPSVDASSLRTDVIINFDKTGEAIEAKSDVILEEENLDLVADALEIARNSRTYIVLSLSGAVLLQIFALGIALSGLISPITVGGLVNIGAGLLWFLKPPVTEA